MEPQNTDKRPSHHPGLISEIAAGTAGAAAAFGTFRLGDRLFSKQNLLTRTSTIGLAVVAGFGISGMVYKVLGQRAYNRASRAGEIDHIIMPPEGQRAPTAPQAAQPENTGALDAMFTSMDNAGMGAAANALRRHRADPDNAQTYQTLDNWLGDIAERSPESFAHIQREAILLALLADSVSYSGPLQVRDNLIARAIMAGVVHDLGKMAFNHAREHIDLQNGFGLDPAIADASLPSGHLSNNDKALRDLVQIADCYETGHCQHSTPDIAHQAGLKAVDEGVARGAVRAEAAQAFKANGLAEQFSRVQNAAPETAILADSAHAENTLENKAPATALA